MEDQIVIKAEKVYKDFILPHEKTTSIKGLFTGLAKGRRHLTEKQHALNDISFEIKKGEFFGIVGRNGSGKSTLLKILAGIYQPTSGKVYKKGKLVPFIELGVGFNPELTGRENVYLNGAMLGFSEKQVDAMYDDIVAFAELDNFMDQKLKNYSSGMQVRLAFSVAVRSEADILLIDEVLAVGDADFQRKCFDYFASLKGAGVTVIFVTHDMNAVREYCDRAVLIEKSRVVEQGASSDVAASYTRMFIEGAAGVQIPSKNSKRWGDGAIKYTKVEVSPAKLTKNQEYVKFRASITASKDVDDPICGFTIKNAAHLQIMGTNTLIEGKKIKKLMKGESASLTWKIPNIFNEGTHYIDPAIIYNSGSQTADWWEEACSFKSLRESFTPYATSPPVEVEVEQN